MINCVMATMVIANSVIYPGVLAAAFLALAFAWGLTVVGLFFIWQRLGQFQTNGEIAKIDAEPDCDEESPVPTTGVADELVTKVVKSLFVIHGVLFRGRVKGGDTFFLDTVEGEIERCGFEIVSPEEGTALDQATMMTTREVECPSAAKANCVAKVDQCGFKPSAGRGWDPVKNQVLQKCQVAVYRKLPPLKSGNNQ